MLLNAFVNGQDQCILTCVLWTSYVRIPQGGGYSCTAPVSEHQSENPEFVLLTQNLSDPYTRWSLSINSNVDAELKNVNLQLENDQKLLDKKEWSEV